MKNSNFKLACERGEEARMIFWQECGEGEDASDYIGDTLSDEGFEESVIDRVIEKLA